MIEGKQNIHWVFTYSFCFLKWHDWTEAHSIIESLLLIYLWQSLLLSPLAIFHSTVKPIFSVIDFLFTECLQAKTTEHILKLLSAVFFAIHQFSSPPGNRNMHFLVTSMKMLPINKSSWLFIVYSIFIIVFVHLTADKVFAIVSVHRKSW